MALSRFWVVLFLASIAYLLVLLFSGRFYAIEFAVNGKKDDFGAVQFSVGSPF